MGVYQRGKSRYYDFEYRGVRYRRSLGPVSYQVARHIEPTRRLGLEAALRCGR